MSYEQYRTGTCNVTNGSQVVIFAGGADINANVSLPAIFKVDRDGESTYSIGTISSASRVVLAANYAGSTDTALDFMICRSFTTNRGYWRPFQGDADLAEVLSQETIDKIDTDIANIMSGDATIDGTKSTSFGINTDGNAARLTASGLTASRDYSFPDADTALAGLAASQTWTASQHFSHITVDSAPYKAASWLYRTASYTADVGRRVLANTAGAAWNFSLPSAPSQGEEVEIHDPAGSWNASPLTIKGNGQPIRSATSDLTASKDYGWWRFVYVNATIGYTYSRD